MSSLSALIGHSVDDLPLPLRTAAVGAWVAIRIYTPVNLALREIVAAAPDRDDCLRQILAAGENPADFEFLPLPHPLAHHR